MDRLVLEAGSYVGVKYQPGYHACCIYDSLEEQRAVVIPFIVEGLANNQKVLYVHDAPTPDALRAALERVGVDTCAAEQRGQLIFLTPQETYLCTGTFNPELMVEKLREATQAALAEGYAALRITGETGWMNSTPGASALAIEYEVRLNDFFPGSACIGICQYERHAFDPDQLLDVLMTHPYVLYGSEVIENFYYLPPEVFQSGQKSATRLDHWIANLRDRHRAEEQLTLFKSIVETSHEAISVVDMNDHFVYVNPAQENLMKATFAEIEGQSYFNFFGAEAAEILHRDVEEMLKKGAGWEGELEVCNSAGQVIPIRAQIDGLRDGKGGLRYAIALAHDISERKKTEAALRESEERFRTVSEMITDYAYMMRGTPDGKIVPVWATDAYYRMAGVRPEELPVERWVEVVHPDDISPVMERAKALLAGQEGVLEFRIVSQTGEVHWVRDYARPQMDPQTGRLVRVMGAAQDITLQKEYEESLRKSEERFRKLVEDAPAAIGIAREGVIQYVNPAYLRLFGYDAAEELMGQSILSQFASGSAEEIFRLSVMREGDRLANASCEVTGRRKDGSELMLLVSSDLIELPDGVSTIAYIVDISERKRAMEALQNSEQRFRQLFEQAPLGYQSLDSDGCFLDVNQVYCDRLGYLKEEILGRFFGDLMAPDSAEKVRVNFPKFLERGEIHGIEFEMVRKDGTTFLASFEGRIGRDEQGRFQRTHCLMIDVTEQRQAEERIRAALAEKEAMLREIHHRVKNNLQVMISLLSLQAETMGNSTLKAALQESRDRIRTMAIVHEELYQSGDLARVEMGLYLQKLVSGLTLAYQPDPEIRSLVKVDDVTLPVDQAIPLGLMVNELVTNALKHAFQPGERGEIGVTFSCSEGRCHLQVWDSGVGLPAGLDLQSGSTLGLNLVHILTRQLNGELVVSCGQGARFDLTFESRCSPRVSLA